MEQKEKVLQVKDLVISFKTDKGIVHAVRGVSFDLYKGETLCIVGESGSGKSVTNKAIMGISAKNAVIENGSILFEGEDLIRVSEEEFHRIRGHKIGMIFQDPLSALNPVMKVGKQIIEATMINNDILKKKYNELISKELTDLRNNEANCNYNVSRLKSEIASNEKVCSDLKEINKELTKLNKSLHSLKTKQEAASDETVKEKLVRKITPLEEQINELVAKEEKILNDSKEYSLNLRRYNQEHIVSLKAKIEKYDHKLIEETKELNKTILKNKKETNQKVLEFISKEEFEQFDDSSLDVLQTSYSHRNQVLKDLCKLYTSNAKICKPALKENLNLSKKSAKVIVDEYYATIKAEHEEKLISLNNDLLTAKNNLNSYKLTLATDELARLEDTLRYNELLQKAKDKKSKKMQEINISKSTKEEEFKPLGDPIYERLVNQIKDIKKAISDEKEAFINKTKITKAEAKKMALRVMKEVGIPLPEIRFNQYPFEFSGGMRQRIVIAIALTANPDILICDEPTTALDVTIQAQILELINKLKAERNLSCIFITHDLGVVANMADRVAVMYAGKIVEYGLANEVFFDPRHPYTRALLSSIPDVDSKERLEAIPGTPPDMRFPPQGDAFAARSRYALNADFKYQPPFFKVTDTHYAATWLLYPGAPHFEMPQIVKTRIKNALDEEATRVKKANEENKEEE